MAKYVSKFNFKANIDDYVDPVSGKVPPDRYSEALQVSQFPENRFLALSWFVGQWLTDKKIVIGAPPIDVLGCQLSRTPQSEPELWLKRSIWTDVDYDPVRFLTFPEDRIKISELGISFTLAVAQKLRSMVPLPAGAMLEVCDTIEEACAAFRTADYTWRRCLALRTIPGTKLKGRVDFFMDCERCWRTFTALYRGQVLFTTDAGGRPGLGVLNATEFDRFERNNDKVIIHSLGPTMFEFVRDMWGDKMDPLKQPFEIDLRAFPDAYAFLLDKDLLGD